MKKDLTKTKRSRLDASSWMLLLEAQLESELSIKDFCVVQGISEASFYQWRKRLQGDKGTDSVMFSPIEIQSKSTGNIVVELPGGVVLRFGELPPVEYIRSLSLMFSGGDI
ncbi:MAG: transposase [Thermoanaerobaculia bacterium]|nr:transposase [Thermoanaerobaculia bacterium]